MSQELIDHAAHAHGWISNGANISDSHYRECIYRLPGTPAYASVTYTHNGVMLWGGGQTAAREPRHFSGIGKTDRLVSFLVDR